MTQNTICVSQYEIVCLHICSTLNLSPISIRWLSCEGGGVCEGVEPTMDRFHRWKLSSTNPRQPQYTEKTFTGGNFLLQIQDYLTLKENFHRDEGKEGFQWPIGGIGSNQTSRIQCEQNEKSSSKVDANVLCWKPISWKIAHFWAFFWTPSQTFS